MHLIGRMHGSDWYVRATDLFRLERPRTKDLLAQLAQEEEDKS